MKIKKMMSPLAAIIMAVLSANALADADDYAGATLYTQSNDASQNAIYSYQLDSWGQMVNQQTFATGGKGAGAGLGNQGALALSHDHKFLFAINAGSNDISVFRVGKNRLTLLDTALESGITPVSITVHDNIVYVVNRGDDSIFGFRFDRKRGKLIPLKNSYRKLPDTDAAPAQIHFDQDGDALVVTEKAANKIVRFTLNDSDLPERVSSVDSAGKTPFGFAFGRRNQFFVANAEMGVASASSLAAYSITPQDKINLIAGAVAANQTAACWAMTTPNGRMAFTANTPASSISSFAIDRQGRPSLLMAQAALVNRPSDLAVNAEGDTLYSLNNGDHTIAVYDIKHHGELETTASIANIPNGATGLLVVENDH